MTKDLPGIDSQTKESHESPPPERRAGILIIGSLLWDGETPRPAWRQRLHLPGKLSVAVPIRYARRASKRACTFTMTFAEANHQGTAVLVPCKHTIHTIVGLVADAQALWGAEIKRLDNRALGADWGCVGILFRDPASELCRQWVTYFQEQHVTPIHPVNDNGILAIPWPTTADGAPVDVDLILATATKPSTKHPPSAIEVADAWIGAGHEHYFFNNITAGIHTPDDPAIWARIQEEHPDWLQEATAKYADGIRLLEGNPDHVRQRQHATTATPPAEPQQPDTERPEIRAATTCQFEAYLMVDWSASNKPKQGKDSIWYCLHERENTPIIENPATRADALRQITEHLLDLARRNRATLVGFDFAYGYPQGFVHALNLSGDAPWRAIWDLLTVRITDDAQNRNNRFAVAADLNTVISGTTYPFWGCPASAATACLRATRGNPPAAAPLPPFRLTEQRQGNPQSVWKLFYQGAVGGQVLMGIPYLARLRDHPELQAVSRVWPFETGFTFAPRSERDWTILHAEIYPSLYSDNADHGECTDRAQVRSLAARFAAMDEGGTLVELFTQPDLSSSDLQHVTTEEGWILGVR